MANFLVIQHVGGFFKIKTFSFILIGILIMSCSTETKYAKIDNFLQREYQFNDLGLYNKLIVISDDGNCMNCNRKFALAMEEAKGDKDALFLISNPGMYIDISGYINETKENIILDYRKKFSALNLSNSSAVFYLKENEVVDYFVINSTNVDSNIKNFFVLKPHIK